MREKGVQGKTATLGARDFSSAVSGFCQVFIVTRFSCSFAARRFGLRPKMCRPSDNTENSRRTREKPLVPRVPFARLHPWFGGDGGLLFYFILSKIVALSISTVKTLSAACISPKTCPALSWDQALLLSSWVKRFEGGKANRKVAHLVQDLCTSIACVSESNVYHKWASLEFHSHDYCDIRRILNSTPGPSEGCHQAYYSVQHRNVKRSRKNPPLQLKKYRLIRSGYSFVAVEVKVEKYYKTLDVRSLRKPVRFVFPGVLILTFGKTRLLFPSRSSSSRWYTFITFWYVRLVTVQS